MSKYRIDFKDTVTYKDRILHRIIRNKDNLKGGWIESLDNLSQEGNCFVYDRSIVLGNAAVSGNAEVYGKSIVCENANILDTGLVSDGAVFGDAIVCGDGAVMNGKIKDECIVSNGMIVTGKSSETPILIQNMLEEDIMLYDKSIQIGYEVFNLQSLLYNTNYLSKFIKKHPKYRTIVSIIKKVGAFQLEKCARND